MDTDKHIETWRKLIKPVKAGTESHVLIAIDKAGEVFWGADFGFKPEVLLRYVETIRADIKNYIKKHAAA